MRDTKVRERYTSGSVGMRYQNEGEIYQREGGREIPMGDINEGEIYQREGRRHQ